MPKGHRNEEWVRNCLLGTKEPWREVREGRGTSAFPDTGRFRCKVDLAKFMYLGTQWRIWVLQNT